MVKPKLCILAGGVISGLISILHAALVVKPDLYRYISPDPESELAQIAVHGSGPIAAATAALVVVFAVWALYAFSSAGLIGALPLLRPGLMIIGVIYLLRALVLPTEINMVLNQGYPYRFVVFSTISLAAGLLYLIGVLQRKRS